MNSIKDKVTTDAVQIGDKLHNGAVVVAIAPHTKRVLCVIAGAYTPYVIWRYADNDDARLRSTYSGNYFVNLSEAVRAFEGVRRRFVGAGLDCGTNFSE